MSNNKSLEDDFEHHVLYESAINSVSEKDAEYMRNNVNPLIVDALKNMKKLFSEINNDPNAMKELLEGIKKL